MAPKRKKRTAFAVPHFCATPIDGYRLFPHWADNFFVLGEGGRESCRHTPPGPNGLLHFLATATTGLESLCSEEIAVAFTGRLGKLGLLQGKVWFQLPMPDSLDEYATLGNRLLSLRSIEALHMVVLFAENTPEKAEEAEPFLRAAGRVVDWPAWYGVWAGFTRCSVGTAEVTFRCSAKRTGKHTWTSQDAQRWVGGQVNVVTGWKPDMTKHLLDVEALVTDQQLCLALRFSGHHSMGRRELAHGGHTTLRGSISHCLVRRVRAEKGDVVIDPMCGSGAIMVEAALSADQGLTKIVNPERHFPTLPRCHLLCGDVDPVCSGIVLSNLTGAGIWSALDAMQLDSAHLPFRTGCIDRIVTDLPFGKRVGSLDSIRKFYPLAIRELARVARAEALAVFLTTQFKLVLRCATEGESPLWGVVDLIKINHGGLNCAVVTLRRNNQPHQPSKEPTAE